MNTINQPAITAHHLTLGFKEKLIVSDLSLTIQSGEFIGILGPNGSGKSTFLKTILGLIQPCHGHLFVWGKAPQVVRAQIGYMPQIHQQAIPTHFTGRAILEITIHGMQYGLPLSTRKANAIINHTLEQVHATHYADRPFYQLSGGEKQRIYFAQALLNTPALLLLDEPLANLDPSMQEMFIHLLKTIQQLSGATILLTAHDPNPLLPIMNRVLFFAKGHAIIGETDNIMTTHTLSALYDAPVEVIHLEKRLYVIGHDHHID